MCLHEITEQSWNRKWTLYTNEIQCTNRWILETRDDRDKVGSLDKLKQQTKVKIRSVIAKDNYDKFRDADSYDDLESAIY